MRNSTRIRLALLGALLAVPALRGCKDATSVNLLEIDAAGVVLGTAYLDNNGNGVLDTQDPPLPHVPVVLTVAHGGQVVESVETDSTGLFIIRDIPVGAYRLDLGSGALGDSLEAVGSGTDVTVSLADTARVDFGVSYPMISVEEVRRATPGVRVFTSGIALNPRQSFGDGVVHIQGDSLYLRTLNVARANINTGDSLRLLGRVKIDQGEPVLDEVTPYILVSAATIPLPVDLSTATAATAKSGNLDAALARIRNAEISDTSTVNGDFHFFVNDGSGRLEVVLRSFLQMNTATIRPDTTFRVKELTGLLTPFKDETGQLHWRILPRGAADVTTEVKQANLGLAVSADTTRASKGDRVRFTVVLTNAGPSGASQVQVTDSLPVGFTYVAASATNGSYNPGTGIWDVDSVRVSASYTLTIDADVTTNLLGQFVNRATITRMPNEFDPAPANNTAAVTVTIVAAAQADEDGLVLQALGSTVRNRASRAWTVDAHAWSRASRYPRPQ
ncbi:MAG: DUF11 domain-containing protein [Gemmatimonadetes bacterium]|nr:DUF11 domain-containing protein [Gemmatimonadota bacterium]